MSTLYVDTINEKTSGNGVQIPDLALPAGSMLQVVQSTDSTPTASSASNWTDLPLSVTITPTSTSSKILVSATLATFDHSNNTYVVYFRWERNGTAIAVGPTRGSRAQATTAFRGALSGDPNGLLSFEMPSYLDSPASTSAQTYTIGVYNYNGGTWYYNRDTSDADAFYHGSYVSTITAMEIAQ